jgi:RHS repeat-associated protein
VYNIKDHLGNIRLTYGMDSEKGGLVILEENHYYPFGLKHEKYNSDKYEYVEISKEDGGYFIGIEPLGPQQRRSYQYKYQGQERQDELGLNWDSFKWRNYDYAIGRFMSIDPLAEKYSYQSPYNFAENKIISHIELEGLEGLHHTQVDKAGNRSHIIEKNVVFLRQAPEPIPEGASKKEAEKITQKNIKIANAEYDRIQKTKNELNNYYGGEEHKNSNGESVTFKINYSEITTKNADGNGIVFDNKGLAQISVQNGLISGDRQTNGDGFKVSPATIFTSDTNIGSAEYGLTRGGRKIFVNSSKAPYGTYAHEFIHTLGVPDNRATAQ